MIQKLYFHSHFILVLFIIKIFLSESTQRDNDYPLKFRLNNGNYIVLSSKGIHIYDSSFNSKTEVKTFNSRIIDNDGDAYYTNIAQFLSEDDSYIICQMKDTFYIINKYGTYITDFRIDYLDTNGGTNFYSIIPYGHSNNEYYFYIITKIKNDINNNIIIARKYKYDSNNNSVELINTYEYINNDSDQLSITCELMYYSQEKYIACFYGKYSETTCSIFNINNFTLFRENIKLQFTGGQIFKSNVIIPERNLASICAQQSGNLKCFTYNIENNEFGEVHEVTNFGCDCQPIDMMVEYFPEREEFVFWCTSHYTIYSATLSKEGYYTLITTNYTLLNKDNCDQPKRFNLFYSNYQKYTILTDTDCDPIISIDSIEAPKLKDFPTENSPLTCHENCATCEEQPSIDNNNCLTCKEFKFFELGNCYDDCINGYFIDTNNIANCKCSRNITCKICSSESIQHNLCVSCNKENGYYPRIDDNNNFGAFINCYNAETIANGYYLNTLTGYYEKCYETCNKCSELGNVDDNKCIECISTHEFKTDFENDKNCYVKCDNYYYFDSNKKYHCIDNCADSDIYNKIIENKKKCIDDCGNDPYNKYEYNNKCLVFLINIIILKKQNVLTQFLMDIIVKMKVQK